MTPVSYTHLINNEINIYGQFYLTIFVPDSPLKAALALVKDAIIACLLYTS